MNKSDSGNGQCVSCGVGESQKPSQSAAIDNAIGCLRAAEVEGLYEAIATSTDERLKDLVVRRLLHAFPDLIESMQSTSLCKASESDKDDHVEWHDKIVGMTVSMDVSTGENDSENRVFGTVCEVMLQSCGAQEDTILAIKDGQNY